MIKVISSVLIFALMSGVLTAGEDPAATPKALPKFGAFVALTIDQSVIQGVKVDEADKIWIMLEPAYRHEELVLRISTDFKAGYRNWFNGEPTLVSPAGQNKAPHAWTDWISTNSDFIEYWMGEKLILHLKREG